MHDQQGFIQIISSKEFPAGFHTVATAPWDQGSQQQEYQAKSYEAPARHATGVAYRQDKVPLHAIGIYLQCNQIEFILN